MTKCTSAEKEHRVAEITELLSQHKQRCDILQYASKWELTDRSVDNLIAEATKSIKDMAEAFKEFTLENAIKRHNEIQDLAKTAKQYNVCNDINKDLNKLGGLYKEDNKQKENTIIVELDGEEL